MEMNSSTDIAEQLNFIIGRVPKHSTTKLVFESLKLTNLLQPINQQGTTLLSALQQFPALQLLDLSSNNINILLPTQTEIKLPSVISVNLSDNPVIAVQPCID